MKQGIVVVGSLNMDLVVNVERLPHEGQTLLAEAMSEIPGGKGANQAAAIGKLGAPVAMIGKVGDDPHGLRLLDSLRESGVDTGAVASSSSPTGLAVITVDADGRNHIVVVPGANKELAPDDIERFRRTIEQCEIVVLQLEIPLETVKHTLRLAKALGKTTVLNPAPAQRLDDEMLRTVDILIPNEHELQELAGIRSLEQDAIRQASEHFLNKGVKALIVTLGEEGCCCADRSGIRHYPAYRVEAVDTTAAGDSFIGGFVTGYLAHKDPDPAIRLALKAAALTVTKRGAQSSLPSYEEVENSPFFDQGQ